MPAALVAMRLFLLSSRFLVPGRRNQSSFLAQEIRFVGLLPREAVLVASEMSKCRRGAIDRAPEFKMFDHALGREREIRSDQLDDPLFVDHAGPECVDR